MVQVDPKQLAENLHRLTNAERADAGSVEARLAREASLTAEGRYSDIVMNASGLAKGLLICAQGRWVLLHDRPMAHLHLRSISLAAQSAGRALKRLRLAIHGEAPWDEARVEAFLLLPMVVGLLLGGFRDLLLEISEQAIIAAGFSERDQELFPSAFVRQLCRAALGVGGGEDLHYYDGMRLFKPGHFLRGYDEMVSHIARRDAGGFEVARRRCEAAYPLRARSRAALHQLDAWGHGRVAQACTFDALGTALCSLALWNGLEVSADSRLYPREFIAAYGALQPRTDERERRD